MIDKYFSTPPLLDFDFDVLKDPEFKEDSVREEILAPLIKRLGYRPSGNNQVVRSRGLAHPFVLIGSKKQKIKIIPDYLLLVDEKPCLVLEAKAPSQSIDDPGHVGQAYCYAIHRDIRVSWFGICNGHELGLFHVADQSPMPRFRCRLDSIEESWNDLMLHLAPSIISSQEGVFAKDLGLHLSKMQIPLETRLVFRDVPLHTLSRVGEGQFTLMAGFETDESTYCASFNFDTEIKDRLFSELPTQMAKRLNRALEVEWRMIRIETETPILLTVAAKRGEEMLENENEFYIPLIAIQMHRQG